MNCSVVNIFLHIVYLQHVIIILLSIDYICYSCKCLHDKVLLFLVETLFKYIIDLNESFETIFILAIFTYLLIFFKTNCAENKIRDFFCGFLRVQF